MKKTNVTLSVERSVNNDVNSTYAAGFNKEETAVVVNNERVVNLEEDFNKGATVSSCDVKGNVETSRTQVLTNTSFAIEEDDEEVRTALDNGLRVMSNNQVEMKYKTANTTDSASVNQTITTEAKQDCVYSTSTEEAKAEVVFENNVNNRTEDVEELLGEL